ncbi:MAG: TonB-dependent receptor [Acidobacteriota bacterium]|nr:TonB-dependent receptor [Acidobacteriota bacterium]
MKNLLLIALTIFASAALALGQTTTGRLSGVVSGPDGVLPGATVTATDNNTGKTQTVTTDGEGAFLFPQLEFGTYTVNITAGGFKTFSATEVKIDVGRDYTLNPTLEVGNVQETVTVTAGADVVTATSAQISNTVSPQQILSLPLLARNPLTLTTLQAGVQSNPFQNTTINGMRTTMTNITRDGINIQDAYIRTNATDFAPGRPTVDDTAEFTISTSNQEADQGFGGSQIRLVTPRGGKDISGALYAYNRNSAFAANNFFNNRQGLGLPFRNRNNFGGKVGGPMPIPAFGEGGPTLLRDKGFFFVNYDKLIDPVSSRYTRTILTPGARTGEFRYVRATPGAAIDQTIGTARVICPATTVANTGTCVVSNILGFATGRGLANIPSTINPIIQQRIISQLPTESNFTGGDQLNTAGYTLNRQTNQERTTFSSRFDLDINENHTVKLVYSWNLESNLRGDTDSTGFGPTPRITQTSENRTFAMTYRTVISPTIVNELTGGGFFSEVPWFLNSQAPPFPEYLLAVPLVTNPEVPNSIQGRRTGNKTIMDNVDWVMGKHNLRFGGQYQRFRVDAYDEFGIIPTYSIGTSTSTPQFTAANFPGGISNTQLGTANGLLALLGGIVSAGTQTYNLTSLESGYQAARNNQPFRYSNYSAYISDRWSALNNLTVTGGLRYEVYPAMRIANGLGLEPVIADPDNPLPSILSRTGTYNFIGGNAGEEGLLYKTDYNNFAPQVGFAWSPKFENGFGKYLLGESFVIRGGYSQAYAMESILRALDNAYTGNQGLGGTTGRSIDPVTGNINLNLRLGGFLPPTVAPTLTPPPRTFVQNNSPPITNFFGTVWAIDPKLQIPKIEQYSIGVQREIFGNMAIEARYVGTRSNSLIRGIDYNQVDIFNSGFLADFERARANFSLTGNPFCTTAGCQTLSIFRESAGGPGRLGVAPTTASTPAGTLSRTTFINNLANGTPAQLAFTFINSAGNLNNHPNATTPNATPFINLVANPATGVVDFLTNDAMYYYNSLQLELRRRFAQGLYFQANYTYSKNITNAIGTGQTLFEPYLDINNPDLDRQRADYDQTHVFNFNGVYQLPFGKGRWLLNEGGVVDKIFGGWELSGIVQWASGAPITFIDPRGTLNRDGRSGRQTANSTLSPQEIRSLIGIFEQNGRIYWIDPKVIDPNTGRASNGFGSTPFQGQVFFNADPGQTGNLPRTIVNGPSYFNVNAALLKNITFSERMRLQLRMEAFNVFNNVNFFNNTQFADIGSASFGQVTSTGAARTVQFGARFEF